MRTALVDRSRNLQHPGCSKPQPGCFSRNTATAILRVASISLTLFALAAPLRADERDAAPTFEQSVRPILQERCWKCHGKQAQKSGLDLSTQGGIRKGGEAGAVIVPGKPEESPLFELVRDKQMPPKDAGKPLSDEQVEAIRRWIAGGAKFASAGDAASPDVTQHDVIPILLLRCTVCHGTRVQEAGLDLRTKAAMLKGGKSGPAIVPGKPEESLLLKRVRAEEMPPRRRVVEVSIKPIEPAEIDVIARWIAAGAPESPLGPDVATTEPDPLVSDADRAFWSFRPPKRPAVPAVKDAARVRNPIDAFILAKLEANGLALSPEADRQVLLRRVCFDLIGLPPTPEDADRFLSDDTPGAYERLVDRLLASPQYGERWARYWLDVAGYADSNGVQHADPVREQAWRYRDYVIRAFNDDKPYDRFLHEQLAGDELADYESAPALTPELYDNLVATGFLRLTPDGSSANITNFVPDRLDIIADELNVLSSAVLGLTMKCARCHTHKTDPIPQRDYYRLAAVFKGAYDEHDWLKVTLKEDKRGPWKERQLDVALPEEKAAWEAREKELADAIQQLRAPLAQQTDERTKAIVEERLAKLPEAIREDVRATLATPADKRTEVQKYLASKFEAGLKVTVDELKKLDADFKKLAEETEAKIKEVESRRTPKPVIQALWDRGEPSPTYILRRGEATKPGREVGPGVPSVLTDGKTPFDVRPPWPGAKSTGRRLAFARWLMQPDHPLTARVIANRLWRHHFGAGLVRTLDNFGKTGDPPSHPELLDWLAVEARGGEFRGGEGESGRGGVGESEHSGTVSRPLPLSPSPPLATAWSLKRLHRLMVTSATYRQSSRSSTERERIDPDNRLLSRMPARRLEAEALRDSLLAVAGRLDTTPFGRPDDVEAQPSGLVTARGTGRGWRRSIYLIQRRTQVPTLLEDFDLPQMIPNCVDRTTSTVAPQALHLLNNRGIHDLAESFAERVKRAAGADADRRIETAWRLALGRAPSEGERQLAGETLADLTSQWEKQLAAAGGSADATTQAADKAMVNLCHALFNAAEFLTVD